jgi:hypothetical protein
MRFLTIFFLFLVLTIGPRVAIGAVPESKAVTGVSLVVEDGSGAPIQNELVILQDLDDHEREICRALTDKNGEIPGLNLSAGLYRAIATAPYGLWRTRVREFLVSDVPVRLVLGVDAMPTHGYGDIVPVGARHVHLRVLTSDGHPVAGASVLVRDEVATLYLEEWYRTDLSGAVTIDTAAKPLVVVVVYGKTLVTREFTSESSHETIQTPQQ